MRVSSCLTLCSSNLYWLQWPLGVLLGMRKSQALPVPSRQCPHPSHVHRRVCPHCPGAVSQVHPRASPPTLAPRGPFPTTHLGARGSTVRNLALSWSASTNAGIERTRVKSQPAPYQWRDLGQVLGLPENSACLVPQVQGY